MKILVERELTTAEAGDIAVTAAEGGIGYWSRMDSYQPDRWMNWEDFASTEVPEDFVFYTIREYDPDLDSFEKSPAIEVTPALIARGVQRYLQGTSLDDGPFWTRGTLAECEAIMGRSCEHPAEHPRGVEWQGRPFHDMTEFGAMDSGEADVVIQLGAFGEYVYG